MAKLELTAEEMKVLEETLERSLSDLEEEVGHTDAHDYKAMLKQRRAVLDQLLRKVTSVAVPA